MDQICLLSGSINKVLLETTTLILLSIVYSYFSAKMKELNSSNLQSQKSFTKGFAEPCG